MNFCPATYLFDRDRWYSSYILRISDMHHKRMFTAIDKLTQAMSQFIDAYRLVDFMSVNTHIVVDDYLSNLRLEQQINTSQFKNILTTSPIVIDPYAHIDFMEQLTNNTSPIPITYLAENVGTVTGVVFEQAIEYNGDNSNKWIMCCNVELTTAMQSLLEQKKNQGYIPGVNVTNTYIEQPIHKGKFILDYRKTTAITQLQITFESP